MRRLKILAITFMFLVTSLLQVTALAAHNAVTDINLTDEEKTMITSNKATYDSVIKDLDSKLKKKEIDKNYYKDYKGELSDKYLTTKVFRRTLEEEKAAVEELKTKFKEWSTKMPKRVQSTGTSTQNQVLNATALRGSITYGSNSYSHYNRANAKNYINTWWNQRNSAYDVFDSDCCNFGSQVLVAGGISMTSTWYNKKNTGWDKLWNPYIHTSNFVYIPDFNTYFAPKVYAVEKISGTDMLANFQHYYNILWSGDIITVCDSSGDPFHMFEVSGFSGGNQVLLSSHTDDWKDKLLRDTCTSQGSDQLVIYRIKNGY